MLREKRFPWAALLVLALAIPSQAGVIEVQTGTQVLPSVNLGTAQTGNTDTTNTADRGALTRVGLLKIANTGGAGPTVTVNILGSMDGTNFFNIAYCTAAAPETVTVAAITLTTTATNYYILRAGHPWRFVKLNYSANTNETLTADVYF